MYTYRELLDVMARAMTGLKLIWSCEKKENMIWGRLDEQFLVGHDRPSPKSQPFVPDLHTEV